MMDDTTVDEWMNFFRDAGIPPNVSASYASSFCQNRIHLNMVLELNRDLLKELGVNLIGDAIAILRHAKSFHEQNVRQKILDIMSSECQKEHKKPEECSKKVVSTTDVASTNNRWFDDTQQLSKPFAHTFDSCLYEGSSSHTFNNSSNDAENNSQHERVPGQIFSRLGVKVELVSVDNNNCNTSVKNDTLPTCRFGNNVKYKINKPKKHKNLASKFAKIMAVKQLPRNKLLKRKIMFTAFQKTSTIGAQNIVPDQTRQGVPSINGGQPQLRGILKPQTITLEQRQDMEPEEEDQSQKMTANKLLESVARSRASDLGVVCEAVHYLSNDSTKSEDGDYICRSTDNFCSDDEQQEELSRAPTSDTCKTVRFGPVCIKEFEKDTLSSSGKTATNYRPPIFRRLGARRKGI
ncbi:uncharacterized protein LOC126467730 isoform X4 [Schistocerca serialis cubense]|uniref:uncharacterized protein LOC126467730 isoform X4 n=1 Tax=Schistocerca serialis cubense TaxID=2023355 RepID=UPI00214EC5B4|nr:uncharacterized protein LOC126467730 isoform X4 [Schistocerca serialis cubense]